MKKNNNSTFNAIESLMPQDRLANDLQKQQNQLLTQIANGTKKTAIFSALCAGLSAIAAVATAVCAIITLCICE